MALIRSHRAALLLCLVVAVLTTNQVAAQSCSWYYSCSACANAASSLNCGWCAYTSTCMPGNSTAPASPNTCPYANVNWGFRYNSCWSSEMNCESKTSCSSCNQVAGCGWCSYTQKCTLGSYSGPAASAPYCPTSSWSYYTSSCPATYDYCSSYSSSCNSCRSAPSSYGCGWCSSTGTCSSGSSYGPTTSSCSSSYWYFGYCPSFVAWTHECWLRECSSKSVYSRPTALDCCMSLSSRCTAIYSCSQCTSNSNCLWCGDGHDSHTIGSGGSCMSNSAYCSSDSTAYTSSTCNNYQYTAAAGKSAAVISGSVLMGVTGLFTLVVFLLYVAIPRFGPKLGAAYQMGPVAVRDFTTQNMRVVPFGLVAISILLKTIGLGLDRWGVSTYNYGYYVSSISVYYGLLSARAFGTTISYHELCNLSPASTSPYAQDDQKAICGMLQGGGIISVIFICLALLFQLLVAVFILLNIVNTINIPKHVRKTWLFSGLTWLFTFTVICEMIFGPYFALHHQDGNVKLGPSWGLFIGGFVIDLVLVRFYYRATESTPDPAHGMVASAVSIPPGIAPLIGGITPAYAVNYPGQPAQMQMQPMAYQPVMMQPQGVAYAIPVQQGQFEPAVYGNQPGGQPQPQQPGGQPQGEGSGYAAPPSNNPGAYAPLRS